jgi:hypothetical protein
VNLSFQFWNGNRDGRGFAVIRGPEIRTKQSVIHPEPETNSARTAESAENLTRTGSMPDGSIDALLQFIDGAGTAALGWCLPASQFWTGFSLVSMVSINLGIWFYGVEKGDAGETIEREESR